MTASSLPKHRGDALLVKWGVTVATCESDRESHLAELVTNRRRAFVIEITDQHKKPETAKFIEQLVMEDYKDAAQVTLITDNLNTHTEKAILETLGEERGHQVLSRIDWHYTPKHAGWLDAAEIEIGRVARVVLRKRTPDKEQLKAEVAAYAATMNEQKKGINPNLARPLLL